MQQVAERDMVYENLILLAPCHGLEDFPLYHTGDDAASLLACWTSLWHPVLLAGAKKLPRVERCDYPPDELGNSLFVLPKPCEFELAEDLPAEIEAVDSKLIRGETVQRKTILNEALRDCEVPENLDPELVRDFLALGFTLLQVELLTQQMRYASSIDQSRIERTVFDAAQLALEGKAEACREKLSSCHDALADERSHYYPVDVFLIDLTLLAESTLNESLAQQFTEEVPRNVLASAKTIECLREKYPHVADVLRGSIEANRTSVAGGEYSEHPLPLMSPDSALRQIKRGLAAWDSAIGHKPGVFARRLSGIYPSLGHVIRAAGLDLALHMKFDEGKYPESAQSKTNWASSNVDVVECLARQPLSANADHTFLDLPRELSDAMDTDFVAVRAFWHWPGHVVPWYKDLRRACRFGSALGKFVTLEQFVEESTAPSASDSFAVDAYRYPFLTQSATRGEPNPHSRVTEYWQQTIRALSARGALAMSSSLRNDVACLAELEEVEQCIDEMAADSETNVALTNIDARLQSELQESLILANDAKQSRTVVNPLPFPRRIRISGEQLPTAGGGSNVYAADGSGGKQQTLVDVPAMGFATIRCGLDSQTLDGPDLGEELSLRNEFFQATVDSVTGSLRSFRDYSSRTTRISQQLGLRITVPKTGQHWVDRQAPVAYSIMAADRAEMTANGKVFAEITTQGRMLAPNGDVVGEFLQRFQIVRGSRILTVEIEIETQDDLLLEDDPWNSYYGSRFAFGDESAILTAGRHFQSIETSARRIEAPLFVQIDTAKNNTYVLTGGVPYHRRATANQLDTILVTSGETNRKFRLGVGVDLPSPTHNAVDWMSSGTPPMLLDGEVKNDSGWLFHISAKNVLATSWEPLPEQNGLHVRLVETEGKQTRFRVHTFKPWKQMNRVTIDGTSLGEIPIKDGSADVTLSGFEVVELRGLFS